MWKRVSTPQTPHHHSHPHLALSTSYSLSLSPFHWLCWRWDATCVKWDRLTCLLTCHRSQMGQCHVRWPEMWVKWDSLTCQLAHVCQLGQSHIHVCSSAMCINWDSLTHMYVHLQCASTGTVSCMYVDLECVSNGTASHTCMLICNMHQVGQSLTHVMMYVHVHQLGQFHACMLI